MKISVETWMTNLHWYEVLQLPAEQIGGKGSPTKVRKNIVVKRKQVEHKVVKVDDEGIDEVVCFLKEKGYL